MSPERITPSPEQAARIGDLAHPYLWWEPVGAASHGFVREVAQIMNLGRYDDIRSLEAAVDDDTLVAVMRQAQPGWFDARSWEFWRGRLAVRSGAELPETPPQRQFRHAR